MHVNMKTFLFSLLLLTAVCLTFTDAECKDGEFTYEEAKELFESSHDVWLLSTIIGPESGRKAILKNLVTEEVESYHENLDIDLITHSNVKLVTVYPCMIVINTPDGYQKITCEGSKLNSRHFRAEALWDYEVDDPGYRFLVNKFDRTFDEQILKTCSEHGVDPHLVKAIIKAESNFNPKAVSPKKAQGLMQLIPATARSYGVKNTFDPISNINGGVKVLKDLLDHFENIQLAVAAYNAGKNAVIKYNNSIPPYPETQNYVEKVMRYYNQLKGISHN